MKKLVFLIPLFALAACGEEPAPQPAATPAAAPEPVASLPAPDKELFSTVFAATCPAAEKVSVATCRRAGMGAKDVLCEYGLGEDEYRRYEATLTAGEDEWTLADAETVCAEHNSHHVDS